MVSSTGSPLESVVDEMALVSGTQAARDLAQDRLSRALFDASQGDRAAFALVYGLTSLKLLGICRRLCGDVHAAEDVLQEVYVLVWRRAGDFDPERGSPITWLAAIARNRALDWRRAQSIRGAGSIDEEIEAVDATPSALDVLIEKQTSLKLVACLTTIQHHQRKAIIGAFFDDLTYAQVADREGVPYGTMKSWVRRGLLSMKAELTDP